MARSSDGNAYSASIRKTSIRSTQLPTKPEIRPSGTPISTESTTEMLTTSTAVLAPQMTREQHVVELVVGAEQVFAARRCQLREA